MHKFLPLFLLISLCPFSNAQDVATVQQNDDNAKSGRIHVRAMAFILFQDIKQLELRDDGTQLGKLELSISQLNKPISISTREFSYGVTKDDKFQSLGSVTLPDVGGDFILVFNPTETGYQVYPVRTDDPDFQGGDTYLINASPYRVQITLGTASHAIEPMKAAGIRPVVPDGEPYYQAMFAYDKDDKSIPFNNTRWPVNPNLKTLVFVYQKPTSQLLTYCTVTDLAMK